MLKIIFPQISAVVIDTQQAVSEEAYVIATNLIII